MVCTSTYPVCCLVLVVRVLRLATPAVYLYCMYVLLSSLCIYVVDAEITRVYASMLDYSMLDCI